MAYQIDRYNGTLLVSIDDQTINTTATDLRLVGRNYAGYGEIQNENFLHLLENFANSSPPSRPIIGQIWYDSVSKKLKFYDGNKFKVTSGAEASANPPAGLSNGEFWWDTINEQLYSWNGNEFILVGPERAPTLGATAAVPDVVTDVIGTNYGIIKLQVDGTVVGIISNSTFNLSPVFNPIDGFFTIRQGINLRSVNNDGLSTTEHYFWGTASNADKLDGFTSNDFLRAGNTVFNSLIRFSDSGFTVGDQNDLAIKVVNGNEVVIENTLGQPIIFRNTLGTEIRDVALIRQDGVVPGSTDLYSLGRPGIRWKEVNAESVKADTFYGRFVGEIETPLAPDGSTPPLAIQAIAVSGNFAMTPQPGQDIDFSIDLAGSSGSVNLSSGSVGSIDNFNIGQVTPGTARFTTLTVNQAATFSSTVAVNNNVNISGSLTVNGNVIFSGTGYMKVPSGTDLQRPATPVAGMIRFNTDDGTFEGFDGLDWIQIAGDTDVDYGLITTTADTFVDYGGLG